VARREARHLSAATVVKILAAAEHERYARVLTLIAGTGVRRGEALAMRWDAVSLAAGTLKVAATMNVVDGRIEVSEPKSGRSRRTLPLSPAMVSLLKAQRATQAEERLRAGVAGVTVHTLRHSAAVAWLEAGVHIKAVADLLGHSSIAITGDIYGHASDAATRSAVDGLSEALGL
jgi:integrase